MILLCFNRKIFQYGWLGKRTLPSAWRLTAVIITFFVTTELVHPSVNWKINIGFRYFPFNTMSTEYEMESTCNEMNSQIMTGSTRKTR